MEGFKQISLFDIELPPMNAESLVPRVEKKPLKVEETQRNDRICFARVPDCEFGKGIYGNMKLPTVNSILKKIHEDSYAVSVYDFLSDVFECGAIAISNKFLFNPDREEQYKKIISKYDKKTLLKIQEVFSDIYFLLTSQIDSGFNDYLGELYMRAGTSNNAAGQFFTPYHVSRLCSEFVVNGAEIDDYIEHDKILTLNEPTCGSGGMVIATVDVLYNKYHFNYSRNLLVECSDIDMRCVHMTYLQLALAGVSARIYHRNTLTMETWECWETPAYIMQYWRFKNVLETVQNIKSSKQCP